MKDPSTMQQMLHFSAFLVGKGWTVRSHQTLSISHLLSPTPDKLLGSEVVGIRGCLFEVSIGMYIINLYSFTI